MNTHYLLWATGKDQPGIVAAVAKILYENKCNLEDSSMMRLGSEFGILLIFSSPKKLPKIKEAKIFQPLKKTLSLSVGTKLISNQLARFQPLKNNLFLVSVHGADRPGIVYHVTSLLKKGGFNITDLATHRTAHKNHPGFILFIEGELSKSRNISQLESSLRSLQKKLKSKINIRPIQSQTF